MVERLLDFYASQVVAFYDPEPRRFYVVRGTASTPWRGWEPETSPRSSSSPTS